MTLFIKWVGSWFWYAVGIYAFAEVCGYGDNWTLSSLFGG